MMIRRRLAVMSGSFASRYSPKGYASVGILLLGKERSNIWNAIAHVSVLHNVTQGCIERGVAEIALEV